jgi:aspartyl/asparaginyl beta-hydroxylase (cupin superfamily)
MKLDVPYKIISEISTDILDNIIKNFTEEDWYINDYRRLVGTMKNTNSIGIKHTEKCVNSDPYSNDAIRSIKEDVLYDKYYSLIEPILEHLKTTHVYRQYAAFFARLEPHSCVGAHKDGNKPFLALCNRIHVPIITNPAVKYIIEGVEYYWERGKIYEFDNMREHAVVNRSNEYRVHLVINLYNLTDEELNN